MKVGQAIKFVDRETGNEHYGTVIGRAGKATGKNKNWYNIEYT